MVDLADSAIDRYRLSTAEEALLRGLCHPDTGCVNIHHEEVKLETPVNQGSQLSDFVVLPNSSACVLSGR